MKHCRVRLLREVSSDMPAIIRPKMTAPVGEYAGLINKHGAVCIILGGDSGLLGVKPGEFVLIDDREDDEFACMLENDSIGGC